MRVSPPEQAPSSGAGRAGPPDVSILIQKASNDLRPLPVENPAAALWWRIVAADASTPGPAPKRRIPLLPAMTQTSHDYNEDYSYSPRPDNSPGIGW